MSYVKITCPRCLSNPCFCTTIGCCFLCGFWPCVCLYQAQKPWESRREESNKPGQLPTEDYQKVMKDLMNAVNTDKSADTILDDAKKRLEVVEKQLAGYDALRRERDILQAMVNAAGQYKIQVSR